MGTVINLRQERKRKARAEAQERAAENRARHGRTKAERLRDKTACASEEAAHGQRRLDPSDPAEGDPA